MRAAWRLAGAAGAAVLVLAAALRDGAPPAGPVPAAAAPVVGAIAARVLGGWRVEHLVSDGVRWHLRTAAGIHPLPILRAQVADLRWGDADNTLVGRSAFGPGQPNRFFTYRINRPPSSADVPLRAAAEGVEVDVVPTGELAFPDGLPLGVTLELNAAIDYRQYLVSFLHREVIELGVTVQDEYLDGRVEEVVRASAAGSWAWPLVLDLDRLGDFRARPYLWELRQIALRADGHVLAVVQVEVTAPDETAAFESRRFAWCGEPNCDGPPRIEAGPEARMPFGFGGAVRAVWAVVDVTAGQALHVTAPPRLRVDVRVQETRFGPSGGTGLHGVVATEIRHLTRDGHATYTVDSTDNLRVAVDCSGADPALPRIVAVDAVAGVAEASAAYHADLAGAVFPAVAERARSTRTACLTALVGRTPHVVAIVNVEQPRVHLTHPAALLRAPGVPERAVLLLNQPQPLATSLRGDHHRLVVWDPGVQPGAGRRADVRHEMREGDVRQLASVGRGLAVLGWLNTPTLSVVPLEGDLAGRDLPLPPEVLRQFVAIDRAFLFNAGDRKFYRSEPILAPTYFPAPLAPADRTAGDYHVVPVR